MTPCQLFACQNDGVVYIYHYNHNIVVNLRNIQGVIRMDPRKTVIYKDYVNAFIPCFYGLLQCVQQFLQLAYEVLFTTTKHVF
jgi:hypothetical protein